MHLAEGMLTGATGNAVLAGGALLAAAGTVVGLRRLDYEQVPRVALLSAAFFVASMIHVPVGPTAIHLVLNGLMGLVLGWAAVPAILVALLLQAVLFQFGGLTTLGLNTVIMAAPAVAASYLFGPGVRSRRPGLAIAAGVLAGATGVLGAALIMALALSVVRAEYVVLGQLITLFNLGLAVVEGLVTGSAVVFLARVCPELLDPAVLWEELPQTAEA